MSIENVERAERLMSSLPLEGLATATRDPAALEAMTATWARYAGPEMEPVQYSGLADFVDFWSDWLEPWESFRIESEEFLDAGDKVVQLARQTAGAGSGTSPSSKTGRR